MKNGKNELQTPQVDLNSMKNLECDSCSCQLFKPATVVKIVPGILVGQTETQYVPVQIMRCDDCGAVPAQLGLDQLSS